MTDTKALEELVNVENWSLEYYPMHYADHYVCNIPFPKPDQAAAELAELKADKDMLSNLLAGLHSDGGHHEGEVGTKQAVEDALNVYYFFRAELADKERELDEARKVIAFYANRIGGGNVARDYLSAHPKDGEK